MTPDLWPIPQEPFLHIKGSDYKCGTGSYDNLIYKFDYSELDKVNIPFMYVKGWAIPEDKSFYLWEGQPFHIVGAKEIAGYKRINFKCKYDTDYENAFNLGWIRVGSAIYYSGKLNELALDGYLLKNWDKLEEIFSFFKPDLKINLYDDDKETVWFFDGDYDLKQSFYRSIKTVADFMRADPPGRVRREKKPTMTPIQFIRSRMAKEPFEQIGIGEGKWRGLYNPGFKPGDRVRWSSGEHESGFPVEGATGVITQVKPIGPKITARVIWDALNERGENLVTQHSIEDLEPVSGNPVHHRFDPDLERELDSSNPQEPNEDVQGWAMDYVTLITGFPAIQETPYVQVIPEIAREIARIYDKLPECAECPEVREAYEALNQELAAQLHIIVLTIEAYDGSQGEPYKSSLEMMEDIKRDRHLWVFSGGADHPMMTREQTVIFRAVHDVFGHAAQGFAFGPRGEENAWMEHCKLFTPLARAALTTETRAQNSWVNAGPYSHLPVKERPYAQQKAVLIPQEFWTRPEFEEAYQEYPEFVYGVEA